MSALAMVLIPILTHGRPFSPSRLCKPGGLKFGILPSRIRAMRELSMGAKVLYSELASREATQDQIFPSIATIARAIGVSTKQARRYVRELENAGLIGIEQRKVHGKPGHNDSNKYVFLWHRDLEDLPNTEEFESQIGTPKNVPPGMGVLPKTSLEYSQKRESIKIIYKDHPMGDRFEPIAAEIHRNHPQLRRDIGIKEIIKRLTSILKHKQLNGESATLFLQGLIDRHKRFCQSEQWRKDDGRFAKSLCNWLAPTMERYEQDPPVERVQTQSEIRSLSREDILG